MDKQEFVELFNKHFENLRNYLYFKTGDIKLSEDIAQDSFVKLWEKKSIVRMETVSKLLYTIANNLSRNNYRRQQVEFNFINQEFEILSNETPEFILRFEEFNMHVQKAIALLTEQEREVFLMNRIENLSYNEISNRLSMNVKSVERRMSKAIRKISEVIHFKV